MSDPLGAGTASSEGSGFKILLAMAGAVFVAWLFLPLPIRTAGEASRRTQSLNNIRNVTLALLNYRAAEGTLPPAVTYSSSGEPLHSWRTLILPYLDEQELYESIDLTRPWDDPVNMHAHEKMPDVLRLIRGGANNTTSISAFVGTGCLFLKERGRNLERFPVSPRQILMLAELPPAEAVPWMKPEDNAVVFFRNRDPSHDPMHDGVICVSFADGSATALPEDLDQTVIDQLISIHHSLDKQVDAF